MLSAYFDESGVDRPKSAALTVAGYISTDEMWSKFQVEWQAMLDDEGVKRFHMTDLESLLGEFNRSKGWTEERKRAVIQRAHKIINTHTLTDIEFSLIWSDYDEVMATHRGKNPPSAYAVLVNACLKQSGDWAKANGYVEPINYIFEHVVEGAGWVLDSYQKADKDPKAAEAFSFGSFTYGCWQKYNQLQAADVIAYEQWKQMENRIVNGEIRKQRDSMANLKTGEANVVTSYFHKEGLAKYIALINPEENE
jgi:hypothetical protein